MFKALYKVIFILRSSLILCNKKSIAFTLAEILITLMIIGVIASLTIPALLQNTQDAELKTALKKTYADISQATAILLINSGDGSLKGLCTGGTSVAASDCLTNAFASHMNITKKCDLAITQGCWAATFKDLKGTTIVQNNQSSIILSNGSALFFAWEADACGSGWGGASFSPRCGYINVDINGLKGPNVVGKDIFGFHILEKSVKPWGTQGDFADENKADHGCIAGADGQGCTTQYLIQ